MTRRSAESRIRTAERERRALELRKQGMSFDEIAERVGYANRAAAHKSVMRSLRGLVREPAEEVRSLYLERLDLVMQSMAPRMLEGNSGAALAFLRAMEREAALLGLDAPSRQDVTINAERVAAQVAERTGLPVDEVIAVMPSFEGLG